MDLSKFASKLPSDVTTSGSLINWPASQTAREKCRDSRLKINSGDSSLFKQPSDVTTLLGRPCRKVVASFRLQQAWDGSHVRSLAVCHCKVTHFQRVDWPKSRHFYCWSHRAVLPAWSPLFFPLSLSFSSGRSKEDRSLTDHAIMREQLVPLKLASLRVCTFYLPAHGFTQLFQSGNCRLASTTLFDGVVFFLPVVN